MLVDGQALWKDTGTRAAITPTIGGEKGLSGGPNCAVMWRGTRIAALLNFAGTMRLVVSADAGGTWVDRGAQHAMSNYIRMLPLSKTGRELFWIHNNTVRFSPDWGVTVRTKYTPVASGLIGIEVL
ncbi:MAG: hypothetical protein KatS3mg038_1044 [Candidatus Kapaibacterium sp.]|nr:MAG: hypothetical protein KatS3mg038_1044 [Candidatus Kapabacteria bacterium]